MVASTNARLDADAERITADLPERVGAVLIDGHNPALAYAALTLGVPEVDGDAVAPAEAEGSAVLEDESSSLEQVMAVEDPTPRGSKPMMS